MIRSHRPSDRPLESLTTMHPAMRQSRATSGLVRTRVYRTSFIGILAVLALGIVSCGDDDDEIMTPEGPTASFVVDPAAGTVLTDFMVDASSSSDPQDSTAQLEVRWDWENDGTWDTNYSTMKTATYQYDTPGTKTIALEVKDTAGNTDEDTSSVLVAGELTCAVSADTLIGVAPLTVMFQGSGIDGVPPYAFSWSFGDGDSSTDQNPSHAFATADTFLVELTVIDSDAPPDTCTEQISVTVQPPPMRNTPANLVERWLQAAFESQDSLMYEEALHDDFIFEFLPQDADTLRDILGPDDFWGKTLDLQSAGELFGAADIAEISFDLVMDQNTLFVDSACVGCRLLETTVSINVTFDEPVGDPLVLTIDSPQTFVVARDPDDTMLWVLWRQTDVAPAGRTIGWTRANAADEAVSWGRLKGWFK